MAFNVRILAAALALAAASLIAPLAARSAPRVFSLDQCADQYVLALATRGEIGGLSPRALDADSYMRASARGLPLRRASSEAVLGARAEVLVRSWGGDARLQAMLARRGLKVVSIDDATDFAGVRANVRKVAQALDARPAGEALIARMDAQLAAAHGAWGGRGAIYLTSAGYTAGPGTLIDTVLTSAGLTNLTRARYFSEIPLERLVMNPPPALVLGFYDAYGVAAQRWGPARSAVMQHIAAERIIARLPASMIGCPAWFAADAVTILARARGGER